MGSKPSLPRDIRQHLEEVGKWVYADTRNPGKTLTAEDIRAQEPETQRRTLRRIMKRIKDTQYVIGFTEEFLCELRAAKKEFVDGSKVSPV